MIVEKQPWIKINEKLSFFQCISYDLVKMQSIINLEFEDLAWYLEETAKGRLPKGMKYPEGVKEINRYVDKPVILIGAYYDGNIANEESIVTYLKNIGIEVTFELDQKALQVFKDFRRKEVEFHDYSAGKTDKFPEGIGKKEDFDFLISVGNKAKKNIIDHFTKNKNE